MLIVGGGITGAALAHRAAREGLSVALVDKGDFACGTSSRSSRLIHGGLRYLSRGQIRIVADSLREQARLAQAAPHLVRAITFLFPLYQGSPVPHWIIRGLISVYQGLRPRESRFWHVKVRSRPDMPDYIRVTSMLPEDNRRFVDILRRLLE